MEFDIHFDPPRATAQEKQYAVRNGRVVVYETAKARDAKNCCGWYLLHTHPESR